MKVLISLFLFLGSNELPKTMTNHHYVKNERLIALDSITIIKRAKILDSLKSKFPKSEKCNLRYFEIFPSDFQTFVSVFGFEEEESGPLYDNSMEHVSFFSKNYL